uniref:protein kinase C n=1 Tax=Sinocyclocheilus anshuiensis TaxID=1608454 RepID=A0A671QXD5_9TELE
MLISDLDLAMTYTEVCEEVRTMWGVRKEMPITLKWIDDEGDPCTISSQMELEEAFRIYTRNRCSGLLLHVFPSIPEKPGMPCPGEDKSIYRRGARRWRKLYRVNGHLFQAKRFNRKAYCGHCSERIWGLGRQGYKCINCKLLVHKRCHKLVPLTCQRHMVSLSVSSKNIHHLSVVTESLNSDLKAVVDGIEGIQISQGLGLGDFDLIRVIGRGSYAKVLLARLKKNEQIYAMKVVKKELVHDDEDIDWVQTEKHVFEQASTNPFLVGLHSCFQTESRLFLVIEYVNGGDLMFHMQRQRKLPEEHARFYAAEVCIALNFLHEKGIIYRDLKLDNVLLDQDGHIKITDYGMCKVKPNANLILEKPIRIPRSLSVKAASVLKGFLNKDPKERLGCQVQTGFTDIKFHTFFRSIDWDQLEQKQVTPPFKPQITDNYGLDNFDTQFTNEPVQLTPDDEDVIKRIDQSEFEGFEYINPLLLSTEETV